MERADCVCVCNKGDVASNVVRKSVCVCGVLGAVREGVSEIESVYFFFCSGLCTDTVVPFYSFVTATCLHLAPTAACKCAFVRACAKSGRPVFTQTGGETDGAAALVENQSHMCSRSACVCVSPPERRGGLIEACLCTAACWRRGPKLEPCCRRLGPHCKK